jgi:putative membrane protein
MRAITLAALLMVLMGGPSFAHGEEAQVAGLRWTLDPWVVAPLAVAALLYAAGAAVLWRRRGHAVRFWHGVAFNSGWLTLAAALVSPIHWLGERLFTFHMIEHEIVMAISAPLLVLAKPIGTLLWGLPSRLRATAGAWAGHPAARAVWNWLTAGRNATLLHGVAIWLWHAPVFFDAAVANVTIHRLQHLSFLATGLLFWWSVLRRCDYGVASWNLFITMLHTSVLGALMTLAPHVLYRTQTMHSAEWGLLPLQDQQLAGVIMWIPAGTVYAGAALALAALWIQRSGRNLEVG